MALFDHDEARRLRREGVPVKEISDRVGIGFVSVYRVTKVVVPEVPVPRKPSPRRFDHDEARRLRVCGASYLVMAERFGVSRQAVEQVCKGVHPLNISRTRRPRKAKP
jgi:hypothetical protein